jgi:hypothetical protein
MKISLRTTKYMSKFCEMSAFQRYMTLLIQLKNYLMLMLYLRVRV